MQGLDTTATATGAVSLEALTAALDAHAIVTITDADGVIVYANDQACAITRYPREELLGSRHCILDSGHHPREFFRALWRTIAAGHVWRGEFRNRARDGTLYWVDTTIVPLPGPDGRPRQHLSIGTATTVREDGERACRDPGERRPWEQRLQEANDTLRRFNRCAEVIALAGTDGGRFFEEITAGVAAALDARAGFVAAPLEREPGRFRTLAVVLDGQAAPDFAFTLDATPFARAAEPVWVESAGTGPRGACETWSLFMDAGVQVCVGLQLRGNSGRVVGVAAFGFAAPLDREDFVTSVLRLFAARAASELERREADGHVRWLASMLDQAREAIVVREVDGRVRYWNKGAERLLGWSAAEVLGRDVREHVPMDPQAYALAQEEVLACGESTAEFDTEDRDGRPLTVERHCTLVRGEDGQPTGVLAILSDVTERKRARQELEAMNRELESRVQARTRELEQANRELEAFATSVSHDLRAPLAAIEGFSGLLASIVGDTLPERAAHALRRIRAGTRQMESLIEGLLSLARVSRDELRVQDVDLSALAQDVLAQLQATEPREGVQVHIQPGLRARGDERLLRQVLANLLGNAWKFTSRQPQAHIAFGREDGGEYFVRDDGPGFDMEYAHRLFGAFQRLHNAHEFPGSGIGLATVRRIVERHGGAIRGESGPEGGAWFRFTLGA